MFPFCKVFLSPSFFFIYISEKSDIEKYDKLFWLLQSLLPQALTSIAKNLSGHTWITRSCLQKSCYHYIKKKKKVKKNRISKLKKTVFKNKKKLLTCLCASTMQ